MFSWTDAQLGIREPVARSSPKTIAACLLMPCSAVSVWNSLGFQSCGSAWPVPHTRACVPWQSLEDSLMVIGSHPPHSVPVALSASWRLVWRASFTASSQVTLLAEVLKGCGASVLRQSWGAWAGSAVLSKVQVTPIEQIRWPKKPWVQRLDCCPDRVWINMQAPVVNTWQYSGNHILYHWQGQVQVTALSQGCSGPALNTGQFSRTQRRVGTKTETFRFYWAYFLFRNEGQFSHFWAILLSVLQNCM